MQLDVQGALRPALVNKEELRLADKYVKYLEDGHTKSAPAGGIALQAPVRFPVSNNLMSPKFLIPEGVSVRPFIEWIS